MDSAWGTFFQLYVSGEGCKDRLAASFQAPVSSASRAGMAA